MPGRPALRRRHGADRSKQRQTRQAVSQVEGHAPQQPISSINVMLSWDVHGTWKRWPIILDRGLLASKKPGLQLVEGRARVGILRGRSQHGDFVADRHLAWVGRGVS